jgi:predicted RND superfamily exporter protein
MLYFFKQRKINEIGSDDMHQIYSKIVTQRKRMLLLFAVLFLVCFFCSQFVAVNYDMTDYLPKNTHSTASLEIMREEFGGGIPNARVMIRDVSIPEALEYKAKMQAIEGVIAVTWLDDVTDITVPLAALDPDVLDTYYKDRAALLVVTIDEDYRISAVEGIRQVVGQAGALTGTAVSTADATTNTVKEILKITVIAVLFALVVLILTTTSWIEPILILAGLGIAVMINNGSNLIFGEISFVTNAAGSVLQMAVSLDYSVFLLHRFHECREHHSNAADAMVEAMEKSASSILSSGLTTVIGFLALVLMQFKIGADLGLALAKGVAVSLVMVFAFMPALIVCTHQLADKTRHKQLLPSFGRMGKLIRKVMIPMACVFAVLVVPSYLGSNANDYLYGSTEIFSEGTQYGEDTAAIEAVFGQNDTYVLLVPKGDTATQKQLSEALHQLPEITDIISFVDMAGAEIPPAYLDEATLAQLEGERYSRMVLTVNIPYEGADTFALVRTIRQIADQYYPEDNYLAGTGVSTYDLKETITADMVLVNLMAIGAVLVVLMLTLKALVLPFVLVLSIETAIWLNLTVPYFMNQPIYYLAYLIISSIQLGATVDYAILMTDRYRENRQKLPKNEAVCQTWSDVFVSVMTSGSVLTVVGLLMGWLSTNQLLSQLGTFLGRGAVFSLVIVLFVLPGLLFICDRLVMKNVTQQKAVEQETNSDPNDEL